MTSLVQSSIARGWIKPAGEPRRRTNPKRLAWEHARRDAWLAAGLTTKGTARRRPYMRLAGLSPSQIRARVAAQKTAWRRRQKPAA